MLTVNTKFKVIKWYDKKKNKILFGVDVSINDTKWLHCSEGKEAMFFDERKQANKYIRDMKDYFNSLDSKAISKLLKSLRKEEDKTKTITALDKP